MTDILFIKTSSLGDVIHHMPAVMQARRHYPTARFTWVVEEAFAPLVRLHPAVDDVLVVATRRWRKLIHHGSTWHEMREFAVSLRARAYDEIIDSQGLLRSALMARLPRGRVHGYDTKSIREQLACPFYDVRHQVSRSLHAIERNKILTALALGYRPDAAIDYGLDRSRLAANPSRPYGVLLPSTARAEKRWSEDRWIALGKALEKHHDLDLVIPWGTATEEICARRIASSLMRGQVPGRQPLDGIARLIAGASLVVGVDTGLSHLAAALLVPLVAIFTASDPHLTGPMGSGPIKLAGSRSVPPGVDEVIALAQSIVLPSSGQPS